MQGEGKGDRLLFNCILTGPPRTLSLLCLGFHVGTSPAMPIMSSLGATAAPRCFITTATTPRFLPCSQLQRPSFQFIFWDFV